MYLILGLLGLLLLTTVDTEPCRYNAELINTCTEENKTGKRFNIYHTNTLNLTYDTSCSCTITGLKDEYILVAVTNTPGSNNCGSSIDIFSPDATGYFITCIASVATYEISLTTGTTATIIFKTAARTFSTSAFCIFVQDNGSSNMTIKCGSRTPLLFTSTTSTFSTTKSSAQTSITTKEQKSTKTVKETSTTKTETAVSSTADGLGESNTTLGLGDAKMSKPSQQITFEVVLPVGFVGFTFGVLLTFGVMCFIFRRQKIEIKKQLESKTQIPVTPHVYDQLAIGNNAENACYEHIQDTETSTYENVF